jgi:hypothetical protein
VQIRKSEKPALSTGFAEPSDGLEPSTPSFHGGRGATSRGGESAADVFVFWRDNLGGVYQGSTTLSSRVTESRLQSNGSGVTKRLEVTHGDSSRQLPITRNEGVLGSSPSVGFLPSLQGFLSVQATCPVGFRGSWAACGYKTGTSGTPSQLVKCSPSDDRFMEFAGDSLPLDHDSACPPCPAVPAHLAVDEAAGRLWRDCTEQPHELGSWAEEVEGAEAAAGIDESVSSPRARECLGRGDPPSATNRPDVALAGRASRGRRETA